MAPKPRRKRGRVGRTAGSPPNREAILAAARAHFARHGYDGATIRGIAAQAGVDPALVHHYFGSKDRLLVAALELPVNPREVVPEVLAGGVDGLGERLLRRILSVWASDMVAGGTLVGLIRASATHEHAARMMREFFTHEVIERVAKSLDMPQPRLRAALAGSQLIGLAMARFVVRFEPIASADIEDVVKWYAPTLQRYLAGPLAGDEVANRRRRAR